MCMYEEKEAKEVRHGAKKASVLNVRKSSIPERMLRDSMKSHTDVHGDLKELPETRRLVPLTDDARICYYHDEPVQRKEIFDDVLEELNSSNKFNHEVWIDRLINKLLGLPEGNDATSGDPHMKRKDELLKQHMNFNTLNKNDKRLYLNYNNVTEATIYDTLVKQIDMLQSDEDIDKKYKKSMQMGAALNGLARMLAHKLGDMSATDQILELLIKRLQPSKGMETATSSDSTSSESEIRFDPRIERIRVFALSNPFLMYLHNEVNSRDAVGMLRERSSAFHMQDELDSTDSDSETLSQSDSETASLPEEQMEMIPDPFIKLMEKQALIQIEAMRSLEGEGKNVHAYRTNKLSIDDPAGVFSEDFLSSLKESESSKSIKKVEGILERQSEMEGEEKNRGELHPAVYKAQRHSEKSYKKTDGAESRSIKDDLKDEARTSVINCLELIRGNTDKEIKRMKDDDNQRAHSSNMQPGNFTRDDVADNLLKKIVDFISEKPIVITRFAGSLLDGELSGEKPKDKKAPALKAGTPFSYISLEELIDADKPIRCCPPGEREVGELPYIPSRTEREEGSDDIRYTALLYEKSKEGKERGVCYPQFRVTKNRLFAGKQNDASAAVFGTLCLKNGQYYGLDRNGNAPGTYGDVVFVFKKDAFSNCVYTFGDRSRGYTSLEALVMNLFASIYNIKYLKSNTLVHGMEYNEMKHGHLGMDLIKAACPDRITDKTEYNLGALEVQIFDEVELSKRTVDKVYFMDSVTKEQRKAIMDRLNEDVSESDGSVDEPGGARQDMAFYQYLPLPADVKALYVKKGFMQEDRRPHIAGAQVLALLKDDERERKLRDDYGFHEYHTGRWRTDEEKKTFKRILAWFKSKSMLVEVGQDDKEKLKWLFS